MLDQLILFADHLGPWGYLVNFLVVALECQALVGPIMPVEILVLMMGSCLAGPGVFDLRVLIGVISAAVILGDSIGYEPGRHLGRGWLLQHGKRFGLRQGHLDRVDDLSVRHSGKAVFGSHFLPLLREFMPFADGSRRRCNTIPYFGPIIISGGCHGVKLLELTQPG